MFRNAYQRGLLTVFFAGGTNPLTIWDTRTQDGYISRFLDQDIKSMVLEIGGTNVSTSYMICPKGKTVLGINMPFLVMIVKNLKKYFSFEVTILDETGTRRRFRVSNFQSSTQILPLCTAMPIGLSEGWNQIQFNLAEFTRRAYKKQFVEVQKLKVNANIRLKRIYFCERLLPEDQLPAEYKLFFPISHKGQKGKKVAEEPAPPPQIVEAKRGSKASIKAGSKTSIHTIKPVAEEIQEEAQPPEAPTEIKDDIKEEAPVAEEPQTEDVEGNEEGPAAPEDTEPAEPGEAPVEAPTDARAEAPAEDSTEAPTDAPADETTEVQAEESPPEVPAE